MKYTAIVVAYIDGSGMSSLHYVHVECEQLHDVSITAKRKLHDELMQSNIGDAFEFDADDYFVEYIFEGHIYPI